jgi:hypothetical protein
MPLTNRPVWYVAIPVVLGAIGIALYVVSRPKSLQRETLSLMNAFFAGDTDTLFARASDEEVRKCGFTRENYRAFFRELIQPRIARFNSRQKPVVENLAGQTTVYVQSTDADSHKHEFSMVTFATTRGPITLLGNQLIGAWIAEYVERKDQELSGLTVVHARLEGLAHDRSRLERLGIKGFFNVGPQGTEFETWDELEARWSRSLAVFQERARQ